MKIRAGLIGSTGYTGLELTRLLASHPNVELAYLASTSSESKFVHNVFPHFKGRFAELRYRALDLRKMAEECDAIFLAISTEQSADILPKLRSLDGDGKTRIIDLSSAYRVDDIEGFRKFYRMDPPKPVDAVYGLPELHKDRIAGAKVVANPGCMATCSLIPLLPLFRLNLIDSPLFINAYTGSSGSGKRAKAESLSAETRNSLRPYKIHKHRHRLEVEMIAGDLMADPPSISFTAVSTELARGIQCMINAKLKRSISRKELISIYRNEFKSEPFVRLMLNGRTSHHAYPNPKLVIGSNFCDIGFELDETESTVTIVSAIDNLMKGAAGQAIQNMNLMFGLDESAGIDAIPVYPL